MRKVLVAGTAVAFALAMTPQSFAQEAPAAPSLSEQVPMPDTESYTGFWRITAISVGAVVGVVVVNAITGGLITPVLLAGTEGVAAAPAMMQGAAAAAPAAGAAVVDAAAAAPAAAAAAPAAGAAVVDAAAAVPAAAPAAAAAVVDAAAAGGAAVANAGTAVAATTVSYTTWAYQGVASLVGSIGGGYIGNWVYGQ
jgi:hypothetical protein